MPEAPATSAAVAAFLRRWEASGAAERANYQLFLSELCDLLEVPRPEPTQPDDRNNAYVFERAVTFRHGTGLTSTGRIDLYKRGCFVLEAKQGSDRPGESQPLLVREEETAWMSGRRGTAVRGTRGWDVAMGASGAVRPRPPRGGGVAPIPGGGGRGARHRVLQRVLLHRQDLHCRESTSHAAKQQSMQGLSRYIATL